MNRSRDLEDSTPLRVRRGRVASVDLYEIKDSELDALEKGTPADLQLNFAVFLLSTSFSAICTLASATFANSKVENIFNLVAIVGLLLGVYLLISWWRTRTSLKGLCARIRERIPPDQIVNDSPDAGSAAGAEHDEPTPPQG